jgi:hypothetical protein
LAVLFLVCSRVLSPARLAFSTTDNNIINYVISNLHLNLQSTFSLDIAKLSMAEWKSVLNEAREARNENAEENAPTDEAMDKLRFRFPALNDQLWKYRNEICSSQKNEKGQSKELILETRAALRFGLCCVSFENAAARSVLQDHAVINCQIHAPLSSILCLQAVDSKCRILSAQLLSNLVTCNSNAAQSLSSSVAISPSDESISSNIEKHFSEKQGNDTSEPIEGPNWVDCILSSIKSSNRDAAAAVAAALHNCIVSLDKSNAESWSFIKRLASDPIFISTILRNIVSAKAPVDEKDHDEWDGATEWFYLLLIKLISLGMMSLMYTGISRCPLSEIQSVLPEQNVLLHCMVKQIDENKDTTDVFAKDGKETYTFLANLFCRLRELSASSSPVDDDAILLGSAVMSILEILSTILAVDNAQSKELREHLCTVSDILPTCATGLGALVDDLDEKNAGLKAREMKMPLEQQNLITLLVRVLANLCFSCRQNQDLMRTTLVPHTIKQSDTNSKGGDLSRSALHVLLSCTAFSTACFTLREWSVIAIRNVLENNPQNQEVVARLDAQSPVQTAALNEAGLQVQMDSKGKVSLSTLKESDES